MSYDKKVMRIYLREMGVALAVYAALLVGSIMLARPLPDSALRTVLLVLPMAGFGLMIWAISRHTMRLDEYLRKSALETFAIAAAIVAGLSFTYGFLETAGFPKLSMFWVWPMMGGAWGLVGLARSVLQR